jgi:hypothetical protein
VSQVNDANMRAGYILRVDAQASTTTAARSQVGK